MDASKPQGPMRIIPAHSNQLPYPRPAVAPERVEDVPASRMSNIIEIDPALAEPINLQPLRLVTPPRDPLHWLNPQVAQTVWAYIENYRELFEIRLRVCKSQYQLREILAWLVEFEASNVREIARIEGL